MKLFIDMSEQELDNIDLVSFTGLNIGDIVFHVNAGQHGGSGTRIFTGKGVVKEIHKGGLHPWGGLSVLVRVLWDNGEEYLMDHKLAKKAQ